MQATDSKRNPLLDIFPSFAVATVKYLHRFDPTYEPTPRQIRLSNSFFTRGDERCINFEEALELIFRQLNHVDGSELISQEGYEGYRSMSVGDVVNFVGIGGVRRWFVCEGLGWAEINRYEAEWLLANISPRDFWGTFDATRSKWQERDEYQKRDEPVD